MPAAVAVRPSELAVDEQLWARDFFRLIEREDVGTHPLPGPGRAADGHAGGDRAPGAAATASTPTSCCASWLGLGDDEIAALHAAGVTSTEPLAQDWR